MGASSLALFVSFFLIAAAPRMAAAEVRTTTADGPAPQFLTRVGALVFFGLFDEQAGGWQVWRTDTTPEGTFAVRTGLGADVELERVGDRLFFGTRGGLWTSDGTAAGTTLVRVLDFYPTGLKEIGEGLLYFTDANGGFWRSDGTADGTVLVRFIDPFFQLHDISPAGIIEAGPWIFFRAGDGFFGTELWRSDGTWSGTQVVADLNPGEGSFPGYLRTLGDSLVFAADDGLHGWEPWVTDGEAGGTRLLADVNPLGSAYPRNFFDDDDGFLLFSADDGTGHELWRTDGTVAGTRRVTDINPAGPSHPTGFVEVDDVVYFRADDGRSGSELWRTDGTAPGTRRVADVNVGGSGFPRELRNAGGVVLFAADDGVHGEELWRSDGTEHGTRLVADLDPRGGSHPKSVVVLPGRVVFTATDGEHGEQLWVLRDCGGTAGPTPACVLERLPLPEIARPDRGRPRRIADIRPGAADSRPYELTALGRSVLFQAFRDDVGTELFRSDGTEAGTVLVRDIRPGKLSSNPYGLVRFGNGVLFQADGGNGTELWTSDGTTEGTRLVRELASGEWGSYPDGFAVLGDFALFAAWDALHGVELWRTDGTEEGTYLLRDLNPGGDGAPEELTVPRLVDFRPGNLAYFTADDGTSGRQLWRTDGTGEGTVQLSALFRGGNGAPSQLTVMNGEVFLRAAQPGSRIVLWRATSWGVEPVNFASDRRREPGCFSPEDIVALGKRLVFSCRDFQYGQELWTSDGTKEGTRLVKDLWPSGDGSPRQLTVMGDRVYFYAADGHSGWELWQTDGSEGGTVLVRDLDPTDTTVPSFLTVLGDTLFFTAHAPSFGRELWRTDGTPAGTVMVKNIHLTRSGYPEELTDVAGALFFYADDGLAGEELWALTPCGDGKQQPSEGCDDGNQADGDGCSASCQYESARGRCSRSRACASGKHLAVDGGPQLRVRLAASDASLVLDGRDVDPRVDGMTVEVWNAFTGERATFALPASGWSSAGTPGALRFEGGADAACRKARIGGHRLRLACRGGASDLTLDEPQQERLDVRVTVGNLQRWCFRFGGDVKADRGTTRRKPGRFEARHAPAPDVCL